MCSCFGAENLPVILFIVVVVYIWAAWCWFIAILGLAILYWILENQSVCLHTVLFLNKPKSCCHLLHCTG